LETGNSAGRCSHPAIENYRFGFRNEGDFDLRNNAGAAAVLPADSKDFSTTTLLLTDFPAGRFQTTAIY
jgi:hypothetical protein